jgi:hypothetical protein
MQRLLLSAALAFAFIQTSQSFAGTWVAERAGTTFVRLELRTTSDVVEGKIALGTIEVDSKGEVTTVTAARKTLTPIFDVVVRGSTLSFSVKESNDVDRFELALAGDRAELRFLLSDADREELASSGVPAIKPVGLRRVE